jgi:hypothetical protein
MNLKIRIFLYLEDVTDVKDSILRYRLISVSWNKVIILSLEIAKKKDFFRNYSDMNPLSK